MSERELCPHLPPMIHWPDGSVENESAHDCGKPRLNITIGYSDDSDQRMQNAVLDLFEEYRRKSADIPAETIAQWCEEDFSLTPETRAKLLERAKA